MSTAKAMHCGEDGVFIVLEHPGGEVTALAKLVTNPYSQATAQLAEIIVDALNQKELPKFEKHTP